MIPSKEKLLSNLKLLQIGTAALLALLLMNSSQLLSLVNLVEP